MSTLSAKSLRRRQSGVALVVALILLAVMTVGGLAAISTTLVQNKAAANQYDRQTAFQSAEAALRVAQERIRTGSAQALGQVARDCQTALSGVTCAANPFVDPDFDAGDIVTVAAGVGGDEKYDASALATGQPQYVIEDMGAWPDPTAGGSAGGSAKSRGYGKTAPPQVRYYRVTARSGDPSEIGSRSIVTLQATIRQN